jgi:EAL domain-containing protein (putative c-di-GMP-specific phosphodiesterase class I)
MLATGLAFGIVFVFLFTIVRTNYPKSIRGASEWLLACISIAIASIFASGALGISHAAEQLFCRIFFFASMSLILIGLRRFAGEETHVKWHVLSLTSSVLLLGLASLLRLPQEFSIWLTMGIGAVLAVSSLHVTLALPGKSKPELCVAISLVLLIALYILRTILTYFDAASANLHLDDRLGQKIHVLGFGISFVFLMGSFLLLAAKRLRQTLIFASTYEEVDIKQRARRWELGEELRHSIEHNELEVHYQPRVNVRSGDVVAVEALLRWNHPTAGNIRPDLFIPIAEENGFIHTLGDFVLREGVGFAARLRNQGHHTKVSINVSAKQLVKPNFVESVRATICRAGLEPDRIELELTESIALDDADTAIAKLRELRRLGVQMAIDDFGTGYSSLAYLTKLPVSCLKIDRSFIRDITTNKEAKTLVQAITGIGTALGLCIVAEGVETSAQLNLLREAGVHQYQGYLFSPPVNEQTVETFLPGVSQVFA